jgi:ribosomal protein L13E
MEFSTEEGTQMKKAPESIVVRYVGSVHTSRQGRGFSKAELKEAGILTANARKLSIRVDPKRHTKLSDNVTKLKAWLRDMPTPKTKKRTKKKP